MDNCGIQKVKIKRLSKSRIIRGLQCEKSLYLATHQPDLASKVSTSQQMIFDQGHEVGIEAQRRYPGGVLIDAPHTDSDLALMQTQQAIQAGANTIYEATLEHQGVLVKVDILHRKSSEAAWELIEVKSSTGLKEVYLEDVAIQKWVLEGAGIKTQKAWLMHINNECIHPHLEDLFTQVDITEKVEALQPKLPKRVTDLQKMLAQKAPPAIAIGPHCADPYPCPFTDHCWAATGVRSPSVFDIPRLTSQKKWALYNDGKGDLSALNPEEFNAIQKRMIEVSLSQKRFVDHKGIKKALASWSYPFTFLDFETIAYAIPRFEGLKPYAQLPFQWSAHVLEEPQGEYQHFEFLHKGNGDPRAEVAKSLADLLPDSGSVIAYNAAFEGRVLKALGLKSMASRLVDPLPVIRNHVYDPSFNGSFSIKAVAPALLGESASYKGLLVGDGGEAQSAYLEMIHLQTSPARREELRLGLLEYCKKDTFEMARLVGWLIK